MTKNRVRRAATYARTEQVTVCVAAGVWPEHPQSPSMAALMREELGHYGIQARVIGPDTDYNSRGELRVFMAHVPEGAQKTIVSASWHLPRLRRIISREWGKGVARSFRYVGSDEPLSARLAFLEVIKWVLTFVPDSLRDGCVALYRKFFGRSSW